MYKELYEMYQEKVVENLKGLNRIISEVLSLCEKEINKGSYLPYKFVIENVKDDQFIMFSPSMAAKGVIATIGTPYKVHGVSYVTVSVSEFCKISNSISKQPLRTITGDKLAVEDTLNETSPTKRIVRPKWWKWK